MTKLFKTTVLGIGPWCVEFEDGEIITTRSEERARLIADHENALAEKDAAARENYDFLIQSRDFILNEFCQIQIQYGEQKHRIRDLDAQLAAQSRELERLCEIEQLYEAAKDQWNPVYKIVLDDRDKLREQYNDLLRVAVEFAECASGKYNRPGVRARAKAFLATPAAMAVQGKEPHEV